MRSSTVALFCLLVLLWTACSTPASRYPYQSESDPRGDEYVIGVADVLGVQVWGNGELNTTATVRPDGAFTMPLIGDVAAAGRKVSEVRADVAKRLSVFIRAEASSVALSVATSAYRVSVTGNVANSGIFESPVYLRVSELFALAGGANQYASPNESMIIRIASDGKVKRIPVQLDEIVQGYRLEQDLVLRRGDRLHVP